MGYSEDEGRVRVDFFTSDTHKWKETCSIKTLDGFWDHFDIHAQLIESMRGDIRFRRTDGTLRYSGFLAVVLDPYHKHTHPQMFVVPEI